MAVSTYLSLVTFNLNGSKVPSKDMEGIALVECQIEENIQVDFAYRWMDIQRRK